MGALLLLAACAHRPVEKPAAVAKPVVTTTISADVNAPPVSPSNDPAPLPPPPQNAVAVRELTPSGDTEHTDALLGELGANVGIVIDRPTAVQGRSNASAAVGTSDRIDPAAYTDLFARIRGGFKFNEVDSAAVTRELDWFVANPEYVERSFRRAELYLYHIVSEIEARGMPLELALLPVIESAFEPYAYSQARASGLWQFIPGTGSRFGLKQNWWYDGRRDVVESTRAALDYLQYLHDEFNGDWLVAIAGYNCGEAAISRAIALNQAAGRPIDFWNLKLPAETRAYVPKLLAMKRLIASPESHGLTFSPIPNHAYFARVPTLGQIDLRLAAEIAGVTSEEVYELNPAFHRWATDPDGPHFLLLPADAAAAFEANVALLTPDERLRVSRYSVHHGDSMASIAHRFHTTPQLVRELNDLPPKGALVVGTDLRVPTEAVKLPPKVLQAALLEDGHDRRILRPHMRVTVRRGDSLWAIARRHGVDVHTLAAMNGLQPGDMLRAGQHLRITSAALRSESSDGVPHAVHHSRKLTYTVRDGDTLARIARVFQVSVAQLISWNSLSQTALAPGQQLLILLARR